MDQMRVSRLTFILLIFMFASQIQTSDVIFYESFNEPFVGRWTVSEKDDYKGVWKHSQSGGHEDFGLLISEKARKYAIVCELNEPVSLRGQGTTVLQYEVRLQNKFECGGAYLKFLAPQDSSTWDPRAFDNNTPYSVMFGPDKCGATDKVHFIFRHKNPKSGEFSEHHLKDPPVVPSDSLSHVYTAEIKREDNQLTILIDGKVEKMANFFRDFEPDLIPPKMIPDPDDKKPEDWDERPEIPDPNAVKPDDWDEDAPTVIEDEEAVKPEGWLDDEPEEIDDPEAVKPEDWDDEEDGEWEPPKIPNPKCSLAPGCGEWSRPMKPNPNYKGKWHPPMITNPDYKGIWTPQEIPNPYYFKIKNPDFEDMTAVGIEVWTMQDGILFDNILITTDEKTAESYRKTTWKPKFEAEKERLRAAGASGGLSEVLHSLQKKIFDLLYKIADIKALNTYRAMIRDLIEKGEQNPVIISGILAALMVVLLTILVIALSGCGGQAGNASRNKRGAPRAASNGKENTETGERNMKEDAPAAPRRRNTRREI